MQESEQEQDRQRARARESERTWIKKPIKTAVLGKTFTMWSAHNVGDPALSSLKQFGEGHGPLGEKQDPNWNISVEAGGVARWRGTWTLRSWPERNQRQDFPRRDTVPKPTVLSFVTCIRVGHLCILFRYYLFLLKYFWGVWLNGQMGRVSRICSFNS